MNGEATGYRVTFIQIDADGNAVGEEYSETFLSEVTRRKWIALLQRNNYEVTGLGKGLVKEGARV